MQTITFGAGCFWGVQSSFDEIKGVTKTTVGYMGGIKKNPTYEDVCSKKTGHVEVCQVEFDETIITFEKILTLFWEIHDPTQVNGQGPDIGSQYRSVIFFHTKEQKNIAEESKLKQSKKLKQKIATAIEPAKTFYEAEKYHQKYDEKHGKVCG